MKKVLSLAVIPAASLALGSCAVTHEVPTADAVPVPNSRIYAPAAMLKPCTNCGQIIVKRDAMSTTLGAKQPVILNGDKIAWLKQGERFTFYLPAGQYVLSTSCQVAWGCNIPRIVITVQAGGTETYRFVSGANLANSLGIVPDFPPLTNHAGAPQ